MYVIQVAWTSPLSKTKWQWIGNNRERERERGAYARVWKERLICIRFFVVNQIHPFIHDGVVGLYSMNEWMNECVCCVCTLRDYSGPLSPQDIGCVCVFVYFAWKQQTHKMCIKRSGSCKIKIIIVVVEWWVWWGASPSLSHQTHSLAPNHTWQNGGVCAAPCVGTLTKQLYDPIHVELNRFFNMYMRFKDNLYLYRHYYYIRVWIIVGTPFVYDSIHM